jgi:hypothetical protein
MGQAEPQALGEAQRRLWRLITDPSGVGAALAAEGDKDAAALGALLRADRGLPAADRLGVYANAYFVRIHDCLREDFGALARALGAAAFHDLVKTYLLMHPPTRPSLRHAGEQLAAHLSMDPFAEIFSRRCPYAADLARLEWAMAEAFYAEDAPVLVREDLAPQEPPAWSRLRFEPTPSLRLLACAWPVHEVRERFDREAEGTAWDAAPPLSAAPTRLRVWRLEERLRYQAMAPLELEALRAAQAGASFGEICGRVAALVGEAGAAGQAAALLTSWISDGLLARLRP